MSEAGKVLAVALDAVYAYTADPDRWEELLNIITQIDTHLDAENSSPQSHAFVEDTLRGHLDRARTLAGRLYVAESNPSDQTAMKADNEASLPVAYLIVGRDQRLHYATAAALALLGPFCENLEIGRPVSMADAENLSRYRAARQMLKQGAPSVPIFLHHDDGDTTQSMSGFLVDEAQVDRLIGTRQSHECRPGAHAIILPDRTALVRHNDLLRTNLGLTPAELRLASLLKDGTSINEAAGKLGVAVNTARNQLRSVFTKLGVNRQSDMVRHLMELGQLAAFVHAGVDRVENSPVDTPQTRIRAAKMMIDRTRRTMTLPDGRLLAYREYGWAGGMPVLYLHAVLSGSLLHENEVRDAAKLGLRFIVPERPGTGLSTPDPNMSFDTVGRDLIALADHLGLDTLHVLGRSSGAPFALETARQLGARVPRIMLYAARFNADREKSTTDLLGRFYYGMRRIPWYTEAAMALLRAKLSRNSVKNMLLRAHERSPNDYKLIMSEPGLIDFMVQSALEALANTHDGVTREANLIREDQPINIEDLSANLIVWHGSEDGFVSASEVERHFSNLPLEEFRIIDSEGHLFTAARRTEVLERLIS